MYIVTNRHMRSKSVTNEDVDELKACMELGFGFESSPEVEQDQRLSDTLPALGLYLAVNKNYNDSSPTSLTSQRRHLDDLSSPTAKLHLPSVIPTPPYSALSVMQSEADYGMGFGNHGGSCLNDETMLQETALINGCEYANCVILAPYGQRVICPRCKTPFEDYDGRSPRLRVGNRRWGANGYIRAGRQIARLIYHPSRQDSGGAAAKGLRPLARLGRIFGSYFNAKLTSQLSTFGAALKFLLFCFLCMVIVFVFKRIL